MTPTSRRRIEPGAGFVVMVSAAVASLAFFAFGLATPRLDRVARMEIDLGLGSRRPLSRDDFAVLQDVLCDHPSLAAHYLEGASSRVLSAQHRGFAPEGWALALFDATTSTASLVVRPAGGDPREVIEVRARTAAGERGGSAGRDAPFVFEVRPRGKCPTLVEVTTKRDGGAKRDGLAKAAKILVETR